MSDMMCARLAWPFLVFLHLVVEVKLLHNKLKTWERPKRENIFRPPLCSDYFFLLKCSNKETKVSKRRKKNRGASGDSCPVVLAQCAVKSCGCVHVWRCDNRMLSVQLPHFLRCVFIAASVLRSPTEQVQEATRQWRAHTHFSSLTEAIIRTVHRCWLSCVLSCWCGGDVHLALCWIAESVCLCNCESYISIFLDLHHTNQTFLNQKVRAEAVCTSLCGDISCDWFFSSSFQLE